MTTFLPPVRCSAREILRNMTATSRDARLSRRPVTTAASTHCRAWGNREADEILEKFAAKRLIVLNEGTAEIAHDALLTAWPRLRGWLEEDQASWSLHSQLADDAEEWSHGRQPDFLYRGIQLADFQRAVSTWAANPDRYPALTVTEREFLHASERADGRRIRQRWAAVAGLVILLLASLAGAGVATATARNANDESNLATYQRNLAASDELAAESAATRCNGLRYGRAARGRLVESPADGSGTREHAGSAGTRRDRDPRRLKHGSRSLGSIGVNAVAFNRDGSILATGAVTGRCGCGTWSGTSRSARHPAAASSGPITQVKAVAFSPDGKVLATAGDDRTARLWDVATHQQIGASLPPTASSDASIGVIAVAFSPDGSILATAGQDGTARLWDVATHQQIGAPLTAVSDPSHEPGGSGGVQAGRKHPGHRRTGRDGAAVGRGHRTSRSARPSPPTATAASTG